MALPKATAPVYEMIVPSTKKKIKYTPFLVRDKKALMLAHMSEDVKTMVNTLKEIIKNCVVGKIDVDSLATFDIEKIFCMLRAKSEDELVKLSIECAGCKKETHTKIDLTSIEVNFPKGHTNKFTLFDKVGVVMKYPTYDMIVDITEKANDRVEAAFDSIIRCMDYIYNDEEIHKIKDTPKEDVIEFLENLTEQQLKKLESFFETMPKFSHTIDFKCPHCAREEKINIEGIENFF